MYCTKERARLLHISAKNHNIHTERGKFIYKALTLHGKQLFLRHDSLRNHKSVHSSSSSSSSSKPPEMSSWQRYNVYK